MFLVVHSIAGYHWHIVILSNDRASLPFLVDRPIDDDVEYRGLKSYSEAS